MTSNRPLRALGKDKADKYFYIPNVFLKLDEGVGFIWDNKGL